MSNTYKKNCTNCLNCCNYSVNCMSQLMNYVPWLAQGLARWADNHCLHLWLWKDCFIKYRLAASVTLPSIQQPHTVCELCMSQLNNHYVTHQGALVLMLTNVKKLLLKTNVIMLLTSATHGKQHFDLSQINNFQVYWCNSSRDVSGPAWSKFHSTLSLHVSLYLHWSLSLPFTDPEY